MKIYQLRTTLVFQKLEEHPQATTCWTLELSLTLQIAKDQAQEDRHLAVVRLRKLKTLKIMD
jgi:hypothetical protein